MNTKIIVGAGVIGTMLAGNGQSQCKPLVIPARTLLGVNDSPMAIFPTDECTEIVFAHGMNVNGYFANARFAELLSSRIKVLDTAHRIICNRKMRVTLISSTTAYLPEITLLGRLQKDYEAHFKGLFFKHARCVLRVGALIAPTSQVLLGLQTLRRSVLFSRLRLNRATQIPWTDADPVLAVLESDWDSRTNREHYCLAYEDGLDFNQLLDMATRKAPTFKLSESGFSLAWELLGVRRDFFKVSTDTIPRDDFHPFYTNKANLGNMWFRTMISK